METTLHWLVKIYQYLSISAMFICSWSDITITVKLSDITISCYVTFIESFCRRLQTLENGSSFVALCIEYLADANGNCMHNPDLLISQKILHFKPYSQNSFSTFPHSNTSLILLHSQKESAYSAVDITAKMVPRWLCGWLRCNFRTA